MRGDELAFGPGEEHPLLAELFADQLPGARPPSTAIHADDEMLAFLSAVHGGDRDQGLASYFATGLAIARIYAQILRWRFGDPPRPERLLDFASGYGRVTRHLLREIPPERVWVSEIHPGAVAFQERELRVHGLVSTSRAEDFDTPVRFDAILVTSLFTHLPHGPFAAWLRRLVELLTPGGLLVLSAHDVTLRLADERPPAGELLFNAISESRQLDVEEYGSAWIDEAFFRRTLGAIDPALACHRLPRALVQHQDLYLVATATESGDLPDFSTLALEVEPTGLVEGFSLSPDGELLAHGWCLDFTGQAPLGAVEMRVDGAGAGMVEAFGPRPDVADAHYLPLERAAGWQVIGRVPADRSRTEVTVLLKARSRSGAERILFLGSLESALLLAARQRIATLEVELRATRTRAVLALGRLRHRISAMRSSRFWKLRNGWFRIKKSLGLVGKIWPP